jgi:Fe2+ transport system protein FeoA
VRELRSDEPERLVRWKQLGLVPGARCKMLERRELEDVMRLHVSGAEFLTGTEGVTGVYVERDA